jgi:hypothetical protein
MAYIGNALREVCAITSAGAGLQKASRVLNTWYLDLAMRR